MQRPKYNHDAHRDREKNHGTGTGAAALLLLSKRIASKRTSQQSNRMNEGSRNTFHLKTNICI